MYDSKIAIYNNLSLYNLLKELKLDLSISSISSNEENLDEFIKENPNSLIISSDKINKFNNVLILNKPLKIKALIEKINTSLSKANFNIQSNVKLKDYSLDINSRKLKKNKISLKLTEKEVDLIIYLLNSNSEKSALNLQKDVWKHITDLETHTVETHIYRLRKKINEAFEDNNFIINNSKGYKLFL